MDRAQASQECDTWHDQSRTEGCAPDLEPGGQLLTAEIAEKRARSIRYQMGIVKLPLIKELGEFNFSESPVNEALVNDLAIGTFLQMQRNTIFIGGTGTGKSHLAIAIARTCIRDGARVRFFNVVDLVNQLQAEVNADRGGRLSEILVSRL